MTSSGGISLDMDVKPTRSTRGRGEGRGHKHAHTCDYAGATPREHGSHVSMGSHSTQYHRYHRWRLQRENEGRAWRSSLRKPTHRTECPALQAACV